MTRIADLRARLVALELRAALNGVRWHRRRAARTYAGAQGVLL